MDLYAIKNALSAGKAIYDLPLRVAYYARVSTDKDEQIHSLKAQMGYYEDYIKEVDVWSFICGYVDEGISGTNALKRESFMQMIQDAKLKKFDFIVTKEISRFSRNTLDSIRYTQELLRCGVGVYFQSDNINTLMPDAELRLTIMSSIAQDEVRKISERVKFGFKRSIEKGIVLGNNSIWGYRKNNGKLVIDEKEAEIVRLIFDMYANQGIGIRTICSELGRKGYCNTKGNSFSFTTVRNIIANPKYKGYYCGGKSTKIDYRMNERKHLDESDWVLYKDENTVPPIVSEEIWEKANAILHKRSSTMESKGVSYNNKYTYSGKIICAEHNTTYYRSLYRYKSGNKEVWQCKDYVEHGISGCDSPTIYTTELNKIVCQCYEEIIQKKSNIIQKLINIYSSIASNSTIKNDIYKTEIEINHIHAKKDKLLELSINGRISDDEFEKRNNQFNFEIGRLQIQKEQLAEEEKDNESVAHSADVLRKMITKELEFKEGFNNQIVDTLIDHIEVYKTDEKNKVKLKIFFKINVDAEEYEVNRRRGKPSVCTKQHI